MDKQQDEENYVDFIAYYRNNIDDEKSYKDFWKLNREYKEADAKLAGQHGMNLQSHELRAEGTIKSKKFDATPAKHLTRELYKGKADKTARQHGFKGLSFDDNQKEQKMQLKIADDSRKGQASPLTEREKARQAFIHQLREVTQQNKTKDKERDI